MARKRGQDGTTSEKPGARTNGNGANLGFEAQLFIAADKLRKNLEPSDYKHVALPLIFLRYISDAFETKHAALLAEDPKAADDPNEYLAENVFWVPKEARWSHLCASAKQPTIGKLIDEWRYVGTEEQEDDGEEFHEKMIRFVARLREQQVEEGRLDAEISANLLRVGHADLCGDRNEKGQRVGLAIACRSPLRRRQ
jgi:type I restriction-modification system DNA methylase subunit